VTLIAIVVRDVFDALFHPEGRSTLSRGVMRAVRAGMRPLVPRTGRAVAGPLALFVVLATWAALLILGWALIFWPHLDSGFRGGPGEDGFFDAVYFSMVTVSTLGFGDVTPTAGWLQLLAPFEALLGFGLLTAGISWLLQLYPAVNRRRALAYEVSLLREAEADTGDAIPELEPTAAEAILADLVSRVVAVERDLVTFPVSYYFREDDERFSLPAVAPYLIDLAARSQAGAVPEHVRFRARMLSAAIEDLAGSTGRLFYDLEEARPDEVLRRFAAEP
jgi:Ion channel